VRIPSGHNGKPKTIATGFRYVDTSQLSATALFSALCSSCCLLCDPRAVSCCQEPRPQKVSRSEQQRPEQVGLEIQNCKIAAEDQQAPNSARERMGECLGVHESQGRYGSSAGHGANEVSRMKGGYHTVSSPLIYPRWFTFDGKPILLQRLVGVWSLMINT
jgi:hypothetical protein